MTMVLYVHIYVDEKHLCISGPHRLQLVSIWRPLGRLQAGWSSETHNHSPAPGSGSGSGQGKAPLLATPTALCICHDRI